MALPHNVVPAQEGSFLKLVAMAFGVALILFGGGKARAGETYAVALAEVGLTEQVMADPLTGVAIAGYDPVGYFVEGKPVPGSANFELIWNGAAWRFANLGNLEAFRADPQVYAPRFGGYDALSLAAGVTTVSDPRIFAVESGHLYLFRDETGRKAFLASPESETAADAAWPVAAKRLIR